MSNNINLVELTGGKSKKTEQFNKGVALYIRDEWNNGAIFKLDKRRFLFHLKKGTKMYKERNKKSSCKCSNCFITLKIKGCIPCLFSEKLTSPPHKGL